MRSRSALTLCVLLGVFSVPAPARATTGQESSNRPPLGVPETTSAIVVDGVLDESAWREALVVELPYEIDPGENLPARVRTQVLLVSDERFCYLGVRAFDPDPAAIRAHFVDRDTADDDDWILISLDTFFDRRRAFEFRVNPLGVQMDSVMNEMGSGGAVIDATWDAIWESAGRITDVGYEVEIAIPFTSLRFPRGSADQRWGFIAMRHWPRNFSYFFRSEPWNRDRSCTLCENVPIVGFAHASPGRNLELDPSLTGRRTDEATGGRGSSLQRGPVAGEFGASARWGVTPGASLNAALNPDFSQVEADVAQLGINTRFALFYPEKRPFFLEGADLFTTPLATVYTRTVAQPAWGLKLTGKERRDAFGVLLAHDDVTNLMLPANQSSRLTFLERGTTTTVARYRRDVGAQSALGVLVTDRRGGAYANSVFGVDGLVRLSATDSAQFQLLRSRTVYPARLATAEGQPAESFEDGAVSLAYRHEARDWNWWASWQDLGRGFRADVGFIPRVDTRTGEIGVRRTFWPAAGSWFSRASVGVEGSETRDHGGAVTDGFVTVSATVNGPRRSSFDLEATESRERFGGTLFELRHVEVDASARPTAALSVSLAGRAGDAVDYAGGRPARLVRISPGIGYFFGRHLQVRLDHTLERLHIAAGRLYEAHLTQARVVYQFDTRTFVRVIVQYLDVSRDLAHYPTAPDPIPRHEFTQLLFSYKLNPQTVVFVGYADNRSAERGVALGASDRTFFVKLGYAWLL